MEVFMDIKAYETFMQFLKHENRDQAITYALSLIESKQMDIETLYQDLLAPSLTLFQCDVADEDICIWKEHFRTSIIRTILESCYKFVLEASKEKNPIGKKIVVLTPSFEYHEIGAIMVSHYLRLEGFDAHYIGANTPKSEIISALRAYEPDFVALSVTNPYNIVVTKQITDEIKKFFPDVKIVVGGQAFNHEGVKESLKVDFVLQSLDDIKKFSKEVSA